MSHTVNGFLWTFLRTVARGALQIGVVALLARMLAPQEFGLMSAALVVVRLAQVLVELGMGPAIVQRRDLRLSHISTAFWWSSAFGLLLGVGVFTSSEAISRFFHMPALRFLVEVLAVLFPIGGLSIVSRALLQRRLAFEILARIELLAFFLGNCCLTVAFAFAGFGVWALVLGEIAETAIRCLLYVREAKPDVTQRVTWQSSRELMGYSMGIMISRIGNFTAVQGDNLIAGKYLGPAALGIYSRSYQFLMTPVTLFGAVVDQVLFPAMSKVQRDPERLRRAYLRGASVIAMVTLPLSGFLIVMAPEIMDVLLGRGWSATVVPFQILVSTLVFRTGYKMSDSLSRASGTAYARAWRQWIYAAASLSGAYVGHFYGVAGVATGVSFAIVLNFLLMFSLSQVIVGRMIREMVIVHGRYLLLATFIGAIAWMVALPFRSRDLAPVLSLATAAASCGAAMLISALLWPKLFGEELNWLMMLLRERRQRREST